ncbi:MAG: hypothetical protein Q9219_001741 [cf. Caloplaca sp. 3 TL-2023]
MFMSKAARPLEDRPILSFRAFLSRALYETPHSVQIRRHPKVILSSNAKLLNPGKRTSQPHFTNAKQGFDERELSLSSKECANGKFSESLGNTMIASTRRWFKRNQTNFAVGVGVVGAGYVAGQYVLSKIAETRQRMAEDRIAKENLRRRFQQNQEDCTITVLALLPTATENILEALPVEEITQDLQRKKAERLGKSVAIPGAATPVTSSAPSSATEDDRNSLPSLQTDSYIHASHMTASSADAEQSESSRPTRSRVQLWNDLKISSVTRALTLLYTLSLLTLFTRIQLNLLGRLNYLASVMSMASRSPQDLTISLENHDDDNAEHDLGNDFDTNRMFLTFSWWLLHRGWRDVMGKVNTAVKVVFGPLNPKDDVPLEKLSMLILEVRRQVEGSTFEERRSHKWLPYLLPDRDQEDTVLRESGMLKSFPSAEPSSLLSPPSPRPSSSPPIQALSSSVTPTLRRLLDETSDLIDSPPFTQILTLLLDTTFSYLVDHQIRTDAYKLPDPSSAPRIQEVPNLDLGFAGAKLASVLAVMTKQAHAIGNGVPNRYAQVIEETKDLEAFAAVIYSSHQEWEALGNSGYSGAQETRRTEVRTSENQEQKVGTVDAVTGTFEKVWGKITGQ